VNKRASASFKADRDPIRGSDPDPDFDFDPDLDPDSDPLLVMAYVPQAEPPGG